MSKKKFKYLSDSERSEIEILKDKGYSIRAIAKVLNRSPNTISYELNRIKGIYKAKNAKIYTRIRLKNRRFQWSKIESNKKLKEYIISGLKNHWNPKEISGRMKLEKKPFYVSKTAIYEWLRYNRGQRHCKYLYSKRYYKKKYRKRTKRIMIPNRISINERFVGADNRSRYGHWEEDTIVSNRSGSGALSVMIERKSRYVLIRKLRSMSSFEHIDLLQENLSFLKVKSITFDNGIENKNHEDLDIPTFFCDPYSSWQKGSVENVNKMIRRYIPKGTDISKVPDWYIQYIQNQINKKPREILGYRSSFEVAMEGRILKVINRVS